MSGQADEHPDGANEPGAEPGDGNGAMTGGSPEDLLAEALRAKAGQTAGNASVVPAEPATDRITRSTRADQRESVESGTSGISSGWVLVLAVLLGLATGTLIGLLTVI